MATDNLDEMIDAGDTDAIEGVLSEMEVDLDDLLNLDEDVQAESSASEETDTEQAQGEADNTDVSESDTTANDSDTASNSDTQTSDSSSDTDTPAGNVIEKNGKLYVEATEIASKNGQHALPYEVLQTSRSAEKQAKEEAKQLADDKALLEQQVEQLKKLGELHSTQLKDADIDPKRLPEQMLNDPQYLAKLQSDYPEMGDAVAALAQQVQQLQSSQQSIESSPPIDVQRAFEQSNHLQDWQTNDTERWLMAQQIDDVLANDPSFQDKPITERFTEVERRVMVMFGDEVTTGTASDSQPDAKPDATPAAKPLPETPIPNTPSDLGQQGSDQSEHHNILEQDAATMTVSMEKMSMAQIEALLEQASDKL